MNKRRNFLSIGLVASAMLGASVAPSTIETTTQQQEQNFSGQRTPTNQTPEQQAASQPRSKAPISRQAQATDDNEYSRPMGGGRPNRSYPKRWAMPGIKRPNRIIRSRRTRRKHRRS